MIIQHNWEINKIKNKIMSFDLNRFTVEKVNVDCICNKHIYNDDFSICDQCQFISNSKRSCEYNCVEIEIATGRYKHGDDSHSDWKYIQWCCPKCGELLKIDDYCSWADTSFEEHLHICNHCQTPQKYLSRSENNFNKETNYK
jgi:phage terminase large subunit GpA-like protein